MNRQPNYSYPPRHHYVGPVISVILLILIFFSGAYAYKVTVQKPKQVVNRRTIVHNKSNSSATSDESSSSDDDSSYPSSTTRKPVSVTEFPQSIQGTWYSYDYGKLDKLVITSTSLTDDDHESFVHYSPGGQDVRKRANHPSWIYVMYPEHTHGFIFAQVKGWNQSAGAGEYYSAFRSTDNNGKPIIVLDEAGGADAWLDGNFYQSKSIAKQMKKTKFSNEKERPSI